MISIPTRTGKTPQTMFDTKICIVVREDLEIWQKLNVTAFLMSGITGANPGIIGAAYIDDQNNAHLPMSVQPVIVLSATASQLATIRKRAQSRDVATVAYIEEMFATGMTPPTGPSLQTMALMNSTPWVSPCEQTRKSSTRSPKAPRCMADPQGNGLAFTATAPCLCQAVGVVAPKAGTASANSCNHWAKFGCACCQLCCHFPHQVP